MKIMREAAYEKRNKKQQKNDAIIGVNFDEMSGRMKNKKKERSDDN